MLQFMCHNCSFVEKAVSFNDEVEVKEVDLTEPVLEIDEVDFGVGFPWPLAADGEGSSMELIHPAIDNDLGGAWRSSIGDPTPGATNSVFTMSVPPRLRQVDHSPKR